MAQIICLGVLAMLSKCPKVYIWSFKISKVNSITKEWSKNVQVIFVDRPYTDPSPTQVPKSLVNFKMRSNFLNILHKMTYSSA